MHVCSIRHTNQPRSSKGPAVSLERQNVSHLPKATAMRCCSVPAAHETSSAACEGRGQKQTGRDVSRGKGRERTQGWSGHAQRGLKALGWGELNSKHSSPTKERWSTQDKKLQHTLSQIYKANMIYAWDPDLKTVRWENPCYIKHMQDAWLQLLLCKAFPLWHSPNSVLWPQNTVMFAITISCISLLSSHWMSHQHLI